MDRGRKKAQSRQVTLILSGPMVKRSLSWNTAERVRIGTGISRIGLVFQARQ